MSITPYTGGNYPIYRFYISTEPSSMCCEVFPLNFNKTSLDDQMEKGQIFYRRKFTGKLLFGTNSTAIDADGNVKNRTDDWLLLWAYEQADPCARLYLIITKEIDGDIDTYWDGVFSTSDGFFDIDRCTFEVTPLPNDDYVPIFDLADIKHNILGATTIVTTRALLGEHDETFTRNRWLAKIGSNSVLEYLAERVLTGVTVSSEFFTDTPNNYVTQAANHLLHLTIAQKSDIIRNDSTNPATTAMLSWNELMDILWAMFEVKWDYDPDTDTINVEHISWWSVDAGIDLRTQLMTVATNKYSYLKEKMPKYEKFLFMEADEFNFVGTPIWYDSACVDQNPDTNIKELIIPVTTDLEYIIDYNDAISDEGFVILCNYFDDPDYYVEFQPGSMSGTIQLNMHLSWANLHHHYFRYNRVLISGYLNNDLTTFVTALKTKHQECSAIICTDYDPSDEITTELGETYFGGAKAQVQHSELSPSGELKLSLLYGPADNEAVVIPDVKYIYVYEVVHNPGVASTWYAVASQNTASDVVLKIYLTNVDVNDDTADTAEETITILNGTTTDDVIVTWVDPGGGGLCVGALHPDSSDAVTKGWIVYWDQSNDSKCVP